MRRPATIARFVVTVVVNAVDAPALGSLAHIGKEVHKGAPSFADRNSPAAIIRPLRASRVGTARNHTVPRMISTRGVATLFRVAVMLCGQRIAVVLPVLVVLEAVAASIDRTLTSINGTSRTQVDGYRKKAASVRITRHQEVALSGVTRAAGRTARPHLYFITNTIYVDPRCTETVWR
jgi:hypothetical protein